MIPDILPLDAYVFIILFTRVGSIIMVMPGIGEATIPARIRLVFALFLSFILMGPFGDMVPVMPDAPIHLLGIVGAEILLGLMIGLSARLIMTSVHVAGTIIGFQSGLAAAQHFDPNQGAQGAILASFMAILALLIIFTMELHHDLIRAAAGSYTLFPIGKGLNLVDFGMLSIEVVSRSFLIGVQMATPFLVYGLIFNITLGLIARLIPTFQIFFVAMPLNIFVGFVLFSILIGTMLQWFAQSFAAQVQLIMP
jgi:flagellar biosynthetic protein FliR